MKNTKVICGFPGTGKSTAFKSLPINSCSDSDSSLFDKSQFPRNYINHIKALLSFQTLDYIFASSHKEVRDALIDEGISFTIVYPDVSLKDIYLERYRSRGSSEKFITLLNDNFEKWIGEIDDIPTSVNGATITKIKLTENIGMLNLFQ